MNWNLVLNHSNKPQNSSFPYLSLVFVINIQNHKSGESDCREYLNVLISEMSWFIQNFFVLKTCVQSHLPLCSQIYFFSDQYILYMKGQVNSGVDQTELLFECLQVFQSHIHTLQHNNVIKISWRNLWIFQDFPICDEDVSKLFC